MMAGEIEYENFIYENGAALFGVTGHVMIMGSGVVVLFIINFVMIPSSNSPTTSYYQKSKGPLHCPFVFPRNNTKRGRPDFRASRLHHPDEPPRRSRRLGHSGK